MIRISSGQLLRLLKSRKDLGWSSAIVGAVSSKNGNFNERCAGSMNRDISNMGQKVGAKRISDEIIRILKGLPFRLFGSWKGSGPFFLQKHIYAEGRRDDKVHATCRRKEGIQVVVELRGPSIHRWRSAALLIVTEL